MYLACNMHHAGTNNPAKLLSDARAAQCARLVQILCEREAGSVNRPCEVDHADAAVVMQTLTSVT